MIQHIADHPFWFNAPADRETLELSASLLLNDPFHWSWEVWRGSEFVGIIVLWRIAPQVDALLHFVFFDENLVGKRQLLLSFLEHCFEDLGFRRISMEIPESVGTLVRFARKKLGFRFEGEDRTTDAFVVRQIRQNGEMPNPTQWIASQGSRREGSHWHDGAWRDTLCLRMTAEEFRTRVTA